MYDFGCRIWDTGFTICFTFADMPLIFEKTSPASCLGVWHILETESELRIASRVLPEELRVIDTWKNESRRKQWLACRALLAQLLQLTIVRVRYDGHGKPSLTDFNGHISFSHTRDYAAVLVDENRPAGIDIETLKPRIVRVAERFLQTGELEHIVKLAKGYRDDRDAGCGMIGMQDAGCGMRDEHVGAGNEGECDPQTELLYVYWCAKEALYKFYGSPSLDLKNDIYIIAFDYFCTSQASFHARVTIREGVEDHELRFGRIRDHMFVYTSSKHE